MFQELISSADALEAQAVRMRLARGMALTCAQGRHRRQIARMLPLPRQAEAGNFANVTPEQIQMMGEVMDRVGGEASGTLFRNIMYIATAAGTLMGSQFLPNFLTLVSGRSVFSWQRSKEEVMCTAAYKYLRSALLQVAKDKNVPVETKKDHFVPSGTVYIPLAEHFQLKQPVHSQVHIKALFQKRQERQQEPERGEEMDTSH